MDYTDFHSGKYDVYNENTFQNTNDYFLKSFTTKLENPESFTKLRIKAFARTNYDRARSGVNPQYEMIVSKAECHYLEKGYDDPESSLVKEIDEEMKKIFPEGCILNQDEYNIRVEALDDCSRMEQFRKPNKKNSNFYHRYIHNDILCERIDELREDKRLK